jgi:hypothetical protein
MLDEPDVINLLKARRAHDRRLFAAIIQAAKQGDASLLSTLWYTEPQDDEEWHFLGRIAVAIGRHGTIDPGLRKHFVSFWVNHADDLRAELTRAEAIRFARAIFEPYQGEALTLYRGENREWARRAPSISWTTDLDIARAFAHRSARNHRSGGLVLRASVPAERIIADLTAHGYSDECEYLVDTRRLPVSILEHV